MPKFAILLFAIFSLPSIVFAQFNPNWYSPNNTYVKIGVADDGVFRIDLLPGTLDGVNISGVNPATFKLLEDGVEIPMLYDTSSGKKELVFVGKRNTGEGEEFAYNYLDNRRSSDYRSLYSDSTYYWLTWNGANGLRYSNTSSQNGTVNTTTSITSHYEIDTISSGGSTSDTSSPFYVTGEGFKMHIFNQTPSSAVDITKEFDIPIPDLNRSNSADIKLRMVGGSASRHLVTLKARLTRGGTTDFYEIDQADWSGYSFADLSGTVSGSEIPAGVNTLEVLVEANNSFGGNPNRSLVDYIEIDYAKDLVGGSGQLVIEAPNGSTNSYQMSGFPSNGVTAFHPATARSYSINSATPSFGSAASAGSAFWVSENNSRLDPGSIVKDSSSNLAGTSNSDNYLIIAAPALLSTAQTHASYRESTAGGSYQAQVINVIDIFDQFAFGKKSPIAIQRFLTYATNNWSVAPEFVVLWGDAIYAKPGSMRQDWEVPCFGKSCSDSWYALNTQGPDDYVEALSIGRISARTDSEAQTFIDKVQNYESQPLDSWQKKFIFMTGGSNLSEQNRLNGYALDWGNRMFDDPIGADTTNFFKSDDSALDPTFIDSVDTAISNGSIMLTFFGHSATQTWSIVTNPPEQFNNPNTLPLVFSLGCYTGAFGSGAGVNGSEQVFGERLVTGSPNGAIAHYGGSSASFITPAGDVSSPAYDILREGERNLGRLIRETKRRYITLSANPSELSISTTLQYNLLGDPGTTLSLPSSPDFHLTPAHVSLTPFAPSPSTDDSLTVDVRLTNRGLLPTTDVVVELRHWNPANELTTYTKTVPAYAHVSTVAFRLPVNDDVVGENRYEVSVDPAGSIAEEVESNNSTEKTQIIFGSGIFLALPGHDGLINTTSTQLRVVIANQGSVQTPILFQLSTNPDFSNPQEHTTTGELVAEWDVSGLQSGQTYYWRATVDDPSLPPGWKEGQFTVRTDLTDGGFFQQDPEFDSAELGDFIQYDGQNFEFDQFGVEVEVTPLGQMFVGGNQICVFLGMCLAVFDGGTGTKKGTPLWFHPGWNNPDPPAVSAQRYQDVIDAAADGDYLIFSTRFLSVPGATPVYEEIKQIFRDLGSVAFENMNWTDAYIGIFRKNGGLVSEVRTPNTRINIAWTYDLEFNFGKSSVTSSPIGPTSRWIEAGLEGSFANADSRIGLMVVDLNGSALTDTVWADQSSTQVSMNLLSGTFNIDPIANPQVRLKAIFKDVSQNTTPQLLNWYSTFDLIPELMIDPAQFRLSSTEVSEGENLIIFNQITNLSTSDAKDIVVSYEVVDRLNQRTVVGVDTLQSLDGGATVEIQKEISTIGFAGTNQIIVTVQQGSLTEAITYNNTVVGTFEAEGDVSPPTVTVLIDGIEFADDPRVITNLNDESVPFVSANPTIEVIIKDDNKYLALEDTTHLTVRLDESVVEYALPNVTFTPGTAEKNEARFIYDPEFSRDSTHTLVITGRDASGNASPTTEDPYRVNFRIQTTTEVKNMFNYPNPMNSFTTFAFQLRGQDASVVDDLRLRVFTVNGRLIREFDLMEDPSQLESGTIQVGWNKFTWDGTDEDGDQLANGVYLYKVILEADGENLSDDFEIEKIAVIR